MKSVKRVSSHEIIVDEVKKYINQKNYKTGDKLPSVAELTEVFQVSKSTVREALRFLEGLNIVEVINGKGIFVKDGDVLRIEAKIEVENEKNFLLHTSELRRALEGKAVELAVFRADEVDINEMEMYLNEQVRLKDLHKDSSKVDWAFHKAIYKASKNPVLESIVESVHDTFNKFWNQPFGIEDIFDDSLPFHQTMLEAIKQRDKERALIEFNKIIDSVEENIRKVDGADRSE
ncbi:FadR/GntR family transcriptional regulator [Virgibacillus litoralis]|uniref:DNA-binding FadR family transcriptional regulator n=1 Tax=Virgibacillus litoralis TaxID=578221 RepID=A0ABS4HBQ1_9BACI|nr:FadR/GntR family transcriptional regulator [Virgibacillus litoralis]MBP1948342.1 DNA-binding FadR family transcriptional regulator [Virgibacillus litoralis]